jgi:signal peptidase I
MAPAAYPGDWLVMQRMHEDAMRWAKRAEIVVFEFPLGSGRLATKRVVGLPGDTIVRGLESASVNGRAVLAHQPEGAHPALDNAQIIASGTVFLLGDNSAASIDSRHFGPVPGRQVIGRVLAVIPQWLAWSAFIASIGMAAGFLAPLARPST